MKRIKFYIKGRLPTSIAELVKNVREKKFSGLTYTYIGSVTQLKNGEFVYEGITKEIRDWIKEKVEEYCGRGLLIRGGWKIFIENEGYLDVGGLVSIKPNLPIWFDALESILDEIEIPSKLLHWTEVPIGKELKLMTRLEYLDEAQEKESDEAWKKFWRSLDEHITWPEFIKRFPKLWESYKKRRAKLLERVKKKYPEIDIEPEKPVSD